LFQDRWFAKPEPRVPAGVIRHARKGQKTAGIARDRVGGDVHLQALSGGLSSIA
jgi:hypothetical protein